MAAAEDEVRGVIESQLDAFKLNDFETAYGFAHSGVKAQFTAIEFERMVRGNFGSMLKPGGVFFFEVNDDETGAEAQVILNGEDGERTSFRYFLEKEDGKWRIAAVIPAEVPELMVRVAPSLAHGPWPKDA